MSGRIIYNPDPPRIRHKHSAPKPPELQHGAIAYCSCGKLLTFEGDRYIYSPNSLPPPYGQWRRAGLIRWWQARTKSDKTS